MTTATKRQRETALRQLYWITEKLERWQIRHTELDETGIAMAAKSRLIDLERKLERDA